MAAVRAGGGVARAASGGEHALEELVQVLQLRDGAELRGGAAAAARAGMAAGGVAAAWEGVATGVSEGRLTISQTSLPAARSE